MLALEMLSWLGLGLCIALGRCFFTEDYQKPARLFAGAALLAFVFGAVAHVAAARSVLQGGEFSGLSLLFAGIGAVIFITVEWFWRRLEPRQRV